MPHLRYNLLGQRRYIHERLKEIGLGTVISNKPSLTNDSGSQDQIPLCEDAPILPELLHCLQPYMVYPPSSSSPRPMACHTALRGRLDLERFGHESSFHLEASKTSTGPTWGSASRSCCLSVAKSLRSCVSSSRAGCRTSSSDTPDPGGNTCKREINS